MGILNLADDKGKKASNFTQERFEWFSSSLLDGLEISKINFIHLRSAECTNNRASVHIAQKEIGGGRFYPHHI